MRADPVSVSVCGVDSLWDEVEEKRGVCLSRGVRRGERETERETRERFALRVAVRRKKQRTQDRVTRVPCLRR